MTLVPPGMLLGAALLADGDLPPPRRLVLRVFSDQQYLITRWWPEEIRSPAFSGVLVGAFAGAASEHGEGLDFARGTELAGGGGGVAGTFTRIGNGAPLAAALGLTYLGARLGHQERLAATTSRAGEALVDAGIWVIVSKNLFARARPHTPQEGRFGLYGEPHTNSFPSGHAMAAFAVATVFADEYRDRRWVPWVAYGGAVLVGASRLALGRHFPSDVLAGAVLGNSIGRMVNSRWSASAGGGRRWSERLVPIVGPEGRGFGLGFDLSRPQGRQ
ncbi:MAG TPA: phosphatase PAP2 family protein [Candidatus Polarisedimenticolaceae bacterium]|nr:phosphatase PAP2 family protein [Candidatus Polarisedimenticolaceae bacterium]